MYQNMLGSQDITNSIFSTNLGRFEKRLRTIGLLYGNVSNFIKNLRHTFKPLLAHSLGNPGLGLQDLNRRHYEH